MFEARVPARKFKTYVCTGVEAYAAQARGEKGEGKGEDLRVEVGEKEGSV